MLLHILTYIWLKLMVNVGKYIPYMEHMGNLCFYNIPHIVTTGLDLLNMFIILLGAEGSGAKELRFRLSHRKITQS